MSPSPTEAHASERHQVTLRRLRWAAALSFAPITVSAVVNSIVFWSDRLAERLATHVVQAGICAAVFVLAHGRRAEQRAILLAAGLLLGIGTSLFWSLSLSPRDLDVLVSPIACTMLASTLIFPWGARVQAIVSAYLAIGYFSVASFALDPARVPNVLISLTLGVAISVVGAWVLDRQRNATLVERERVTALADQRERLLEAGRELNGTLELSEVVQRIARIGRRLVGCDAASITLFHEARQVFRTAAISAAEPERYEEVLGIEFPEVLSRPFIDELVRRGALEIPGGTPFDATIEPITARFGLGRTLYVAIQRDGRHLGFLNFCERAATPFEEHRIRLAEGLAHQAAIALANAQLVDELQTANRVKSEFLSTMSHELRTPLHVIMGYTEMAEDRPTEEWAVASAKIRGATRELLEMIEATLTLNRMESGQDGPTIDLVPVRQLWEELDGEFAALPRRPAVDLRWEPVDGVVATDRRKLKTILKNLVGNALKFTTSGEVGVTCELVEGACVFRVRDSGVGIAREHLPHIFEMFRQVDSSDRRSYGGVGLGLYIVRRLVEQLKGEIDVESRLGAGSIFTVTLPRTHCRADTARGG